MKMVSSARRSGASFCFMVLRRWRARACIKGMALVGRRDGAPPRRAREACRRYDASSTSVPPKPGGPWEAEARDRAEKRRRALDTLLKRRAASVLGQWRRSAAERRRQSMALEALRQAPGIKCLGPVAAPRGGKAAAKHCPRGAREEARFGISCGALAPTRGGDGADEERGAAARAVPAWVAPPRDVPRFRKVAAGRDPPGRARICSRAQSADPARRAAPLKRRVERRRLHPR